MNADTENPHSAALLKGASAAEWAQSIAWARNGGYRDGYACERPNLPAWDTIPEWSNAYSEGYALGIAAARRAGRGKLLKQRALF